MKKNLFITIDFPPDRGGVAAYISNICKSFPKNSMYVLADSHGDYKAFDKSQSYKIYRANFFPKWKKAFSIIRKIVKHKNIEMLHISHVLPLGYIALLFKYKLSYTIYLHGLDLHLAQSTFIKKFLLQKILNNAHVIIVNSNYTRKELYKLNLKYSQKAKVIYPCVQNEIVESQIDVNILNKYKDKMVLLTVGRLVKRKGHERVIQLIPKLLEDNQDLKYVIIGNGPEKQNLKELVKNLEIEESVEFLDNIANIELASYYTACNIFIMPNLFLDNVDVEGLGIVFLEAALFKKPVIGGNNGGVAEAIVHNKTGYLVGDDDSQLEEYIQELLKNEKKAKAFGESGYKYVTKYFDCKKQIEKLLTYTQ